MVKPLKFTKTVTTGVLIASFVTSGLPTAAFAGQANAYADEFQSFVESVEGNKADDATADYTGEGAEQAAPVRPSTPAESVGPTLQPAVPAVPEQAAPQPDSTVPAEDAHAGAASSAAEAEADGKPVAVEKDETVTDKPAVDKVEDVEPTAVVAADVSPAADVAEAAAPAAGDPKEVLGTFKTLFPSESFRKVLRQYQVFDCSDDEQITREMLEKVSDVTIQFSSDPFTVGSIDAEGLGLLDNVANFGFYGSQSNGPSWEIEDMGKFWSSIAKMEQLSMLTLSWPSYNSNDKLTLDVPNLTNLVRLQIGGWTRGTFEGELNTGRVFDGGALNVNNLPKLKNLLMDGTRISDWNVLSGFTGLVELSATHNGIDDISFLQNMTKLTSLDLSVNSITDFSPLKPIFDKGYKTPNLRNQHVYKVGDSAIKLMAEDQQKELPVVFKLPNGNAIPAKDISLKTSTGALVALDNKGALPEGLSYSEETGKFTITRDAANKLPYVEVGGNNGKMLALDFNSTPQGGSVVSGEAFIEVKVTNETSNRPPVISGAKNITINQGSKFDPMNNGVTASDPDAGDNATLKAEGTVKTDTPGAYDITYTATDKHGATATQKITVTVNGVPTISGVTDKTIVQGDAFDPKQGVTANDHEQGAITDRINVTGDYDVNTPGDYTITFTVADDNGATTTATMNLTVKVNQAPVINASNLTIVEGDKFDAKKHATATDHEDGPLPVTVVKSDVNPNKYGEYHVTYSTTDKKGLKTEKEITVTVLPKMVDLNFAPVIQGATDKTIVQGDKFDKLAGVTATDKEQGKLVPTVTGDVDVNTPGTYKLKYEAIDNKGAKTVEEITVTVLKNQAPVISAQDMTITEGDAFVAEDHATATDHEDGELRVTVVKSDVNPNKYGVYHVTYSATDKKGLKTEKTITVTVNPRQMGLNGAPTFEGLSDKTIMLGDEFDPKAGVAAKDAEDGTVEFTVKGKVDSTKVGTYELAYTAKDSKGATVTKTITVTVKQPVVGLNQAPTISAADVTIVQGETFDPMAGVTATDPEDGELKFTVTGTVDTEVYGEYELVYQAIDEDGAKVTKTIKVIVLPRLVSLNAVPTIDAHSVTIVQGESFDPMAGVTATDAEDGKLTVKLESGSVDTTKPGEYILVFSATDSAGAKVTKTITVKVVAKQPEAGKPQQPGKPQQAVKPQKPAKPHGTAQLPQTGDASMVAAGATGLMGVLALAAERLRRRRK